MKKNILSLIILATVAVMATAQTATPDGMTMRAFTAGGVTEANSYGVFGQPFGDIVAENGYEVSVGVAQMQLVRDTVYAVVTENTDYTDNGFNKENVTKSQKDSNYVVNGGIYHYDVIHYLYLWVCHDMKDADAIVYNSVALDDYCWTKQNLRTNSGNPMTYTSEQYPNVNVETYGYLYTWDDAQELCPEGWNLPNETTMGLLTARDATTIRVAEDWTTPEVNTNSTRFSAYPAGEFSAAADRFQGMGSQTDWWTTVNNGNMATSVQVNYYCNVPMIKERSVADGLSVRCVTKPGQTEWDALDETGEVDPHSYFPATSDNGTVPGGGIQFEPGNIPPGQHQEP